METKILVRIKTNPSFNVKDEGYRQLLNDEVVKYIRHVIDEDIIESDELLENSYIKGKNSWEKDYGIEIQTEIVNELTNKMYEEPCSVCGGPCDMNTEYEGSAVCKNKTCSVHEE